jgi:hypothetical protein
MRRSEIIVQLPQSLGSLRIISDLHELDAEFLERNFALVKPMCRGDDNVPRVVRWSKRSGVSLR